MRTNAVFRKNATKERTHPGEDRRPFTGFRRL
jgi:hypothetical protein